MANLGVLTERFRLESDWILDRYVISLKRMKSSPYPDRGAQLENEMCIIRVHDSWARFCRDLIFFSYIGGFTKTGKKIPPVTGGRTYSDFMACYKATFKKPPRFEPKWATASDAIDVAQRVKVSNVGTISSALGAVNSPANELRIVRNYYAHRVADTADKIKSISWVVGNKNLKLTPVDIPGAITMGGISYFEQWVYDLQLRADVAAA
jgi:hypothetical protein